MSDIQKAESEVKPETAELVAALFARADLAVVGRAALQQAFPNAPAAMLDTASFHLFTDGVAATAEWLAELERFLRDPKKGVNYGATCHLVYHL